MARRRTSMWSPAWLLPALPGRRLIASSSVVLMPLWMSSGDGRGCGDRVGRVDQAEGLARHEAFQSPMASPWQVGSGRGVGSSAFYGVPVLGAVKIVPRVGGCILTAPALRRVGSDGGTGWYEDDRVRCRSGS